MNEEVKVWPFECRNCWHVWEEEYIVRRVTDRHGNEVDVWMRSGVSVQPPSSGTTCPHCGSDVVTTFPAGYLATHPELIPPATPPEPDATPLLSPVRRRITY